MRPNTTVNESVSYEGSDFTIELTVSTETKHHSVFSANLVTQPGSHEHARQGKRTKQKLPLCSLVDATVLHDA